ncbi:MAG: helix-turn-helix domain-containing protein [Candidatus Geothermincolia bacterium]
MKEPEQDVLTLDEAASYLRLHRRTVEAMLLKGALPGKKIGRQWRILKSELLAFLRSK